MGLLLTALSHTSSKSHGTQRPVLEGPGQERGKGRGRKQRRIHASWGPMSWVIPWVSVKIQPNWKDEQRKGCPLHGGLQDFASPDSVWFISVDYMCILLWTGPWQKFLSCVPE